MHRKAIDSSSLVAMSTCKFVCRNFNFKQLKKIGALDSFEFISSKTECSEKLFMESPSSVTKPINSMYMNHPQEQDQGHPRPRSKLAPKRPMGTNSSMVGNKSSKNASPLGEQNSSLAVASQPPQAKPRALPQADDILKYKPDNKRILEVDASVAAYFADMFRSLKSQ
jgi:hypothetical protein